MNQESDRAEQKRLSVQPTLNDLIGRWVIVEYMAGPKIDEENPPAINQIVEGQPVARNESVFLLAFGAYGIEFVRSPEDRPRFVSWGAVMGITGPTPEEIKQWQQDREREQAEQTEETAPSPARHEVMDLLANADTPSEAADAKAAADGWLLTHPSDGDVRMAREQLEARFPDDAEETSPT